MVLSEKRVEFIGWVASMLAVAENASYLDQARLNFQGTKGSLIVPAVTLVTCLLWFTYGYSKGSRPLWICNLFGIVTTIITIATWFY